MVARLRLASASCELDEEPSLTVTSLSLIDNCIGGGYYYYYKYHSNRKSLCFHHSCYRWEEGHWISGKRGSCRELV